MCKSFVKLLLINFLLLYIFKVNTLYIRQEKSSNSTEAITSYSNPNVPDNKNSTMAEQNTEENQTIENVDKSKVSTNSTTISNIENDKTTTIMNEPKTTERKTRTTERRTTTSTTIATTTNNTIQNGPSIAYGNIDASISGDNLEGFDKPEDNEQPLVNPLGTFPIIAVICCCVVGLIAVSGYRVVKRKNESKFLKSQEYYSSTNPSSFTNSNNNRSSLVNSLIYENENNDNPYLYYMEKNEQYAPEVIPNNQNMQDNKTDLIDGSIEPPLNMNNNLPYYGNNRNEKSNETRKSIISVNRSSITSVTSVSRSSVIRHSFLNPNLNIVRTSKRTQQLYEATTDHPAIIETFPSLERPFEPAVPVPIEESDINSLHPHSIYQMYQDEMEYENYYAYTIDDKEYIIDPTTNRVLEIHDLVTDEYMLVEEELYLDFSGSSSEDSDSEKQTL